MLVPQLTHVPLAERQAMRDGPRDSATHLRLAAATPALGQIEIGGKASRESAGETLTVVAWNVERLRHGDAIAATLAGQAPDVVLLSEVDEGMARSGNGHPLRVLADRLGHAFAYGVELVELGGGNEAEQAATGAVQNTEGFHGNAVTSAIPLLRPSWSASTRRLIEEFGDLTGVDAPAVSNKTASLRDRSVLAFAPAPALGLNRA